MNGFTTSFILISTLVTTVIGVEIIPQPLLDVSQDVQIQLFTLKNPIEPQILVINDTNSIIESNYNIKLPTRIFIHGFYSKGELKETLTEAFLITGKKDVNLIQINWEKASTTFNYPGARGNVELLANFTANFIDFMVENKMLKSSELTEIGFSLGAHIAGIAGKRVRSGKIGKIIGLDPAMPLFSMDEPEARLDRTDAEYVETVFTSWLGFFLPIGLVNFYPNGGRLQPYCSTWNILCQHQTAYKYFAQSVSSEKPLIGHLCESLDNVKQKNCTKTNKRSILGGEPGPKKQPAGIYYIEVESEQEKSSSSKLCLFRRGCKFN